MATQTGSIDLKAQKAAADIGLEVDQHFWYDSIGAHVTEVTQEEWNDISDPNYHSGGNLLAKSTGIAVRDGMTELATFGASGATIGKTTEAHTIIDPDGQRIYTGSGVPIANIGYELINGLRRKYYTFGVRPQGSTIGDGSFAEGSAVTASGTNSHAEGWNTTASGIAAHAEGSGTSQYSGSTASGNASHAEGHETVASGDISHAEGYSTTASGECSHAEGSSTTASGERSHAQNIGTKASKDAQTTLGTHNIEDTSATTTHPSGTAAYGKYAVILGNGTSANARSNALTVDWSGNVVAAGGLTLYNNKAVADFVVEKGTDSGWEYQKWYSGRVEAVYNGSITYSATASSGQLYRSVSNTLAIPNGIFSATPQFVTIGINLNSTVLIGAVGLATSNTNIGFQVWRSTNTNTSTSTTATVRATYVP